MVKVSRKKKESKRRKTLTKHPFRSGLENEIAKQLARNKIRFEYEQSRITYTIPNSDHIYIPDFKIRTNSKNIIYIECKGIWTYEDRYKHLLIRQQHPELDVRFIFSNSKSRISKRSKTSYRDICEGRGRGIFKGITWKYADKKIPKEWFYEE